jgi:hypothetical protein
MPKRTLLLIVLFLYASIINLTAQVVTTPDGQVEFVGLKSSEGKKFLEKFVAQTRNAGFHLCAADFKYEYNLRSSVHVYININDNKRVSYTVVKFVDPVNNNIKSYAVPVFKDTMPLNTRWDNINGMIEKKSQDYKKLCQRIMLEKYPDPDKKLITTVDTERYKELYNEIMSLKTEENLKLIMKALKTDANEKNRRDAVNLLILFIDKPDALNSLLACLSDPYDRVSGAAEEVIKSIAPYFPKPFDWSAYSAELKHIIDGSQLFAFDTVLNLLAVTKISPDLSSALLKNGGELVLDNLTLKHPDEREIAHNFLKQISGSDYGYDTEKWQNWINSLK